MANIYFPGKHSEIVASLTKSIDPNTSAIFPNLRDLMLFAASVGRYHKKREKRVGNAGEIDTTYFSAPTFNKVGVVYLLGLLEEEKTEIFRDGAKSCWDIFEQYCAGGMNIISDWLKSAADETEYAEVIALNIMQVAHKSKGKPKIKIKKPKLGKVI